MCSSGLERGLCNIRPNYSCAIVLTDAVVGVTLILLGLFIFQLITQRMFRYLFVPALFWIYLSGSALAQNQKIVDSLNSVLVNKTGAARFLPLYELTFEYIDRDNAKALDIITQAAPAALVSADSLWIVKCKRVTGQLLSRLDRLSESVEMEEAALAIAVRNGFAKEELMILNSLGGSYVHMGLEDIGLKFRFETLELAIEQNDSSAYAQALNNIGATYFHMGNYTRALDYYLQGIEIAHTIGELYAFEVINVALCYVNLGDLDNAKRFIEQSLETCRPDCSPQDMMSIRQVQGYAAMLSKNNGEAEKCFVDSYNLALALKNERFQLESISFLAGLYLDQGYPAKAGSYLAKGENILKRGSPYVIDALEVYAKFCALYSLSHNAQKIAFYQGKYIQLKDSVYNRGLAARVMAAERTFTQRKYLAKIERQDGVIALKEAIIRQQSIVNILSVLFAVLACTFLIVILRNYIRKRDYNKILEGRVTDRTRELEHSRDALARTMQEQSLMIERALEYARESARRAKGIYFTSCNEIADPIAQSYIERMESVCSESARQLCSVFGREGPGVMR